MNSTKHRDEFTCFGRVKQFLFHLWHPPYYSGKCSFSNHKHVSCSLLCLFHHYFSQDIYKCIWLSIWLSHSLLQGFFRRSIVKMQKKEEYSCVRGANCSLGTGKRLMCSYCRYKKCLEVGMSHEGMLIVCWLTSIGKYCMHIEDEKSLMIPKDNQNS